MNRPSDRNERLMRDLAAAQTPRQQKIARNIYDRLNAGESVDDVRGLIEEMARVIREERQADSGGGSRGGAGDGAEG